MASLTRSPRAAVFDLDGTLVDSVPDLAAALNRVLAEAGLPPQPLDAVARMVGHGVARLVERGFASAGAPLDLAALPRWVERFLQLLRRRPVHAEPPLSRRAGGAGRARRRGLAPGRLHQQADAALGRAAGRARPPPALRRRGGRRCGAGAEAPSRAAPHDARPTGRPCRGGGVRRRQRNRCSHRPRGRPSRGARAIRLHRHAAGSAWRRRGCGRPVRPAGAVGIACAPAPGDDAYRVRNGLSPRPSLLLRAAAGRPARGSPRLYAAPRLRAAACRASPSSSPSTRPSPRA